MSVTCSGFAQAVGWSPAGVPCPFDRHPARDLCRVMEKAVPEKPILLPHKFHDELERVCRETQNHTLRHSEFGLLMKSLQEVPRAWPRAGGVDKPGFLRPGSCTCHLKQFGLSFACRIYTLPRTPAHPSHRL